MLHVVRRFIESNATSKGQRIGYVRVSTIDQNEARLLDGVPVDRTFVHKASGKDVDRPQLKELLAFVRDGDTVICHSMDRLARNAAHLQSTVELLTRSEKTCPERASLPVREREGVGERSVLDLLHAEAPGRRVFRQSSASFKR